MGKGVETVSNVLSELSNNLVRTRREQVLSRELMARLEREVGVRPPFILTVTLDSDGNVEVNIYSRGSGYMMHLRLWRFLPIEVCSGNALETVKSYFASLADDEDAS